jgi:hypothetical protein
MTESDMWKKMREKLPDVQGTRIENAASFGTPDVNLAFGGHDYWLENKVEHKVRGSHYAEVRPTQIAWMAARLRVANNAFFFTFREETGLWSLYPARDALAKLEPHLSKVYINFGQVHPLFRDGSPWYGLKDALFNYAYGGAENNG